MRDYDPTTGRYIQADPLGLVDGASVYGYALQSPLRYTDPRGEQAAETALGIGAGLGVLGICAGPQGAVCVAAAACVAFAAIVPAKKELSKCSSCDDTAPPPPPDDCIEEYVACMDSSMGSIWNTELYGTSRCASCKKQCEHTGI